MVGRVRQEVGSSKRGAIRKSPWTSGAQNSFCLQYGCYFIFTVWHVSLYGTTISFRSSFLQVSESFKREGQMFLHGQIELTSDSKTRSQDNPHNISLSQGKRADGRELKLMNVQNIEEMANTALISYIFIFYNMSVMFSSTCVHSSSFLVSSCLH